MIWHRLKVLRIPLKVFSKFKKIQSLLEMLKKIAKAEFWLKKILIFLKILNIKETFLKQNKNHLIKKKNWVNYIKAKIKWAQSNLYNHQDFKKSKKTI